MTALSGPHASNDRPGFSDQTKDHAERVSLAYVNDAEPCIRRRRAGGGFSYTDSRGHRLAREKVLERIRALAAARRTFRKLAYEQSESEMTLLRWLERRPA